MYRSIGSPVWDLFELHRLEGVRTTAQPFRSTQLPMKLLRLRSNSSRTAVDGGMYLRGRSQGLVV